MDYFTSRNMVILGLAQLGVIVAAILGASVAHKWYTTFRAIEPLACQLIFCYGWLALIIPVVWVWLTHSVLLNERSTEAARLSMLLAGLALLALFVAAGWFGALLPWLRLWGW